MPMARRAARPWAEGRSPVPALRPAARFRASRIAGLSRQDWRMLMSKKKHEWTRKGVTASMAVVMAFGMVPAVPTVALADDADVSVGSLVISSQAEDSHLLDAINGAGEYEYGDYDYGFCASLIDPDGDNIKAVYEGEDFAAIAGQVSNDLPRFLGRSEERRVGKEC